MLTDVFNLHKWKSEEERNRNIRSSARKLNISNDLLLLILALLVTETLVESNIAEEELNKGGFERNFKLTREGHDVF